MTTSTAKLPTLREALKTLAPNQRLDLLKQMQVNELELQLIELYPLSCTIQQATAAMAYLEPHLGHHLAANLFN